MSLKHVDLSSAMRRLADKRIEDAMKAGKFDNLAGAGKPLDLEPMPAEENARMTWWAIRLLKQNGFTPDEIQWRKKIDRLRAAIDTASDEITLIRMVEELNTLVRKLNTLGTNAIAGGFATVDLATQIQVFREQRHRRAGQPTP